MTKGLVEESNLFYDEHEEWVKEGAKIQQDSQNWYPVYQDLVKLIGKKNTLLVYEEFKGIQVSFPLKLLDRHYLPTVIYSQRYQKSPKELAKEWGYSERHIKRLLKEMQEKEEKKINCN
ncbi:hypothetical protein [Vagococcus fessus]|uniref:Mor transcription activator domain-containing protein n=1 Tax=Vagococcus fessus TaxID=120370 RepID=A0A430A8H0_9ENTE|nr:hypothetical protein [Vagococcus fessus]RSU03420.1 hypothetical protein CBF31_06825 [Vagococcus fessus]